MKTVSEWIILTGQYEIRVKIIGVWYFEFSMPNDSTKNK